MTVRSQGFVLVLAPLVLFALANQAYAQTQIPAPAPQVELLRGVILDIQGALVNSASISVENKYFWGSVKVNDEGIFQINVPVGKYQITVNANGFERYRKKIIVGTQNMTPMKIVLKPGKAPDYSKCKGPCL